MWLKSLARTLSFLIAGSSFFAIHLAAQNPQEPSIAEAARRNREQRKASAKPGTVVTNDTLSPSTSSSAAPASASTTPAQAAPTSTTSGQGQFVQGADAAPASQGSRSELSADETAKLKTEISSIKQEFKDKQNEVDLLKRLLDLDTQALYSKPNYSRDTAGKSKVDSEQAELKQKEEEFERLKAKLQSIAPQEIANPAVPKP